MTLLSTDLLQQANDLLNREPKRPKQASLRRAISAAYYALFHLLTEQSTQLLISGANRNTLRQVLRRAFAHSPMKTASESFKNGKIHARFRPALGADSIPDDLRIVASAFVELQQARHEADYDPLPTYARDEVRDIVQQAERAFAAWRRVKGSPAADVYLVALLTQGNMRG